MRYPDSARLPCGMTVAVLVLCACAPASDGNTAMDRTAPAVGDRSREALPSAPAGFSWRTIPDIKASFLQPDGWHYLEAVKGNTFGFYMTREDLGGGGRFETGLSVNVIRTDGTTDVVEAARGFVDRLIERSEELDRWEIEKGPFKGFGCRTRNTSQEGEGGHITQTIALGNVVTNTVYYMWYESPEEIWPQDRKIGEQLLDHFVLDDGY